MRKKYELLKDDVTYVVDSQGYDIELYRIRALIDFDDVKAGDIGGYIQDESNLSHQGNCWVYDDATVFNNAIISGNAKIYDEASVFDNAEVEGDVTVSRNAELSQDCYIYENAEISDEAEIGGTVAIGGSVIIKGETQLFLNDMEIVGNVCITSDDEYAYVKGFGSENRGTLFYLNDNELYVKCGCFTGNVKEFIKKVKYRHGRTHLAKEYITIAKLMKRRFKARGLI